MDDKLKEDISKIVDEAVSSRLSNQQATLTFNLENIDAESRLMRRKPEGISSHRFTVWRSGGIIALPLIRSAKVQI